MGSKIWFIVFRNWNSEQRIHCFASGEKYIPKYKLETKGHHFFQLKGTAAAIKKKEQKKKKKEKRRYNWDMLFRE